MTAMLTDLASELADAINAAGVHAVIDPRNARPPCAIIQPPSFEIKGMAPNMLATFDYTVSVVAPGPGNLDAITKLYDLVEKVVGAVNVSTARPVTITVGTQDYAGYELSVSITARKD